MKIKTYYASTEPLYSNVDAYVDILPENLKRRISKISDTDAKVCSLGGALLLKYASKEFDAEIESVVYSDEGKPYIPGSDFYFSISHTKGYASVSFGKIPSGCDIQVEKDVNLKIAERFFSKKEIKRIVDSENKIKTFFEIWCKKESVYKLKGEQCCTEVNKEKYIYKNFMLNDKLYLCVCAEKGSILNPELIDYNTVF